MTDKRDTRSAAKEPITSDEGPKARPLEDVFKLSWRSLAIGSAILAVAAIAGLGLIAAMKHADELAAIALSLAILAFLIQIVVFIAQAATASTMILRSEALNAQTSALLVDVQASMRTMQAMVADQFTDLLHRVIPESVKETTEKEETRPDESALRGFEQRLTQNLTQKLEDLRNPTWLPSASTSGASDLDAIRTLITLPQDEGLTSALKILRPLSDRALRMLRRYGGREVAQRTQGQFPMLHSTNPENPTRSELLRLGLLGKVAGPESGDYYSLTPLGREAARVLTAIEPLPPNAPKEVLELRERSQGEG